MQRLCHLLVVGAILPGCMSSIISSRSCSNSSSKEPLGHEWAAPKAGDSRSPCPLLNSLANHNFLPRDGHNLNYQVTTSALKDVLNFDPAPFVKQIQDVMKVSSTGCNETFNLIDLNQKPFEHDASLSRNDAFLGDSLAFDPAVWAQTASHFGATGVISMEAAAKARADRVATAKKSNADFNLTADQLPTTFAESGLYLMLFGDKTQGNARTDWVRSMFEQERLPYIQGWNKPQETIVGADIMAMAQKIAAVPTEG